MPDLPNQTKLSATFWGTRGSISTPGSATSKYGGNTASIEISTASTHLILDAGTGIRPLGKHLIQSGKSKTHHIFLSHTHWDHIQGIPFFEPAYDPESKITFYGSPNKERVLEKILTGQMSLTYFPVQMKDLPARIHFCELTQSPLAIGEMLVQFEEQIYHPGGSLRFRIHAGGAAVVYATDVEIDGIRQAPEDTLEHRHYLEYCRFIAGADLLIADAQYTREAYAAKRGWGHSSMETIIETAAENNVKQLALFHHDPDHTDTDFAALEAAFTKAAPHMRIFWAREGQTIAL